MSRCRAMYEPCDCDDCMYAEYLYREAEREHYERMQQAKYDEAMADLYREECAVQRGAAIGTILTALSRVVPLVGVEEGAQDA